MIATFATRENGRHGSGWLAHHKYVKHSLVSNIIPNIHVMFTVRISESAACGTDSPKVPISIT